MTGAEDFDAVGRGIDAVSVSVRPLLVDASVSDLILESDDPAEIGYWYVWAETSDGDVSEMLLTRGEDLEMWFDETGCDWSSEARKAVKEVVEPRPDRNDDDVISIGLPLDDMRDQAVASLARQNSPPVLFRRGGLVTEIAYNENRIPSVRELSTPRMRERLAEVAHWVNGRGEHVKPPGDLPPILLSTPELHPAAA
jgi:hypothetical protein